MGGIWGVFQGAAALELALGKVLASRSMADKLAQPVEMMHAPGERVRAVLVGELRHDDSLEVPLVVGEALDGVLRAPGSRRRSTIAQRIGQRRSWECATLRTISSGWGLPRRYTVSIQRVRAMHFGRERGDGSGIVQSTHGGEKLAGGEAGERTSGRGGTSAVGIYRFAPRGRVVDVGYARCWRQPEIGAACVSGVRAPEPPRSRGRVSPVFSGSETACVGAGTRGVEPPKHTRTARQASVCQPGSPAPG